MKFLHAALICLAATAANAQTTTYASRTTMLCSTEAAKKIGDARIEKAISEAAVQHSNFGGQMIDRSGGLVRVGYHESEFDNRPGDSIPTWQRVKSFWSSIGNSEPGEFKAPGESLINRHVLYSKVSNAQSVSASGLTPLQLQAAENAFLRSALVDNAWSAAFISYLMKNAAFTTSEFEFSASHVNYVEKAYLTTVSDLNATASPYAYRACDIKTTKPRAGDMICYTREGAADVNTFELLGTALEKRRAGLIPKRFAMHCDLVVLSDDKGDSKMESMGGNVFQSVTLRKMKLNAEKTMNTNYIASTKPKPCVDTENCLGNLNFKPWTVLLQFRTL